MTGASLTPAPRWPRPVARSRRSRTRSCRRPPARRSCRTRARGPASASPRRAPRRPRPRSPAATSARPSDQRASIAADRIVPIGLARSWPARCGAEPWIGSYMPNVPCSVRRSPSDADGSNPREPASTLASSDRMSPNRFSVTSTSNSAGRFTRSIAHESTSWWLSSTSGKSAATSSATCRHSRDVARTFALSTLVTRLRRVRASSNASRTIRAISRSEYGSVSLADRSPPVSPASWRAPK